jgi:L-fuconolactonase
VTEADWASWTVDDLVRPVEVAAETFGPDRLLFGSDWPVCLLAAHYGQVAVAAETALERAGVSAAEREAVFGPNAVRIYGLAVTPR